jgi:hypothetical protein
MSVLLESRCETTNILSFFRRRQQDRLILTHLCGFAADWGS